jgi:hypothetical protein
MWQKGGKKHWPSLTAETEGNGEICILQKGTVAYS